MRGRHALPRPIRPVWDIRQRQDEKKEPAKEAAPLLHEPPPLPPLPPLPRFMLESLPRPIIPSLDGFASSDPLAIERTLKAAQEQTDLNDAIAALAAFENTRNI